MFSPEHLIRPAPPPSIVSERRRVLLRGRGAPPNYRRSDKLSAIAPKTKATQRGAVGEGDVQRHIRPSPRLPVRLIPTLSDEIFMQPTAARGCVHGLIADERLGAAPSPLSPRTALETPATARRYPTPARRLRWP